MQREIFDERDNGCIIAMIGCILAIVGCIIAIIGCIMAKPSPELTQVRLPQLQV